MEFQQRRPDGSLEWRRHIPFHVVQRGCNEWEAVHAGNGRLLGRFNSAAAAERNLNTVTEAVPHYKAMA